MFECDYLYKDNYRNKKNKMLIKLQKQGIVFIKPKEEYLDGVAIANLISGRKDETTTGGTGLTQLIKSLEANAEEHGCYVQYLGQEHFYVERHIISHLYIGGNLDELYNRKYNRN